MSLYNNGYDKHRGRGTQRPCWFPCMPAPSGPPSPPCSSGPAGLQVLLQTGAFLTIAADAPVRFNAVVTNETSAVTYDSLTGVFTINAAGVYYFSWWIAVEGGASAVTTAFGLNGSEGTSVYTDSADATDLLAGNALVNVAAAPAVFRLLNRCTDTAFIPDLAVQAGMTVMHITAV